MLKEQGKEDIKVICYEDYPDILQLLKEEVVDATITSQLKVQGKQSIEYLLDYLVYDKNHRKTFVYQYKNPIKRMYLLRNESRNFMKSIKFRLF